MGNFVGKLWIHGLVASQIATMACAKETQSTQIINTSVPTEVSGSTRLNVENAHPILITDFAPTYEFKISV